MSAKTSSRRPNGAGTLKPRSRPMGDHSVIGTDRIAATRDRFRMSRIIDSIDTP
jgi:hypothetical protein